MLNSERSKSKNDLEPFYLSHSRTTMSALENPMHAGHHHHHHAAAAPVWPDPWASAVSAEAAIDPHHQLQADYYQHHMQQGMPQKADSVMNTSSGTDSVNSSGSDGCGKGSVNSKRTVNFKLEIKPDPESNEAASSVLPRPPAAPRKVPSISDLSEADSSVDIPTQVRSSKRLSQRMAVEMKFRVTLSSPFPFKRRRR